MDRKNVVVLGASFDTAADNKKFAEKFDFPFAILSDPQRKLGAQYGAADAGATSGNAKRIAYLIDAQGKIKKVWPKASPATFADDVLKEL